MRHIPLFCFWATHKRPQSAELMRAWRHQRGMWKYARLFFAMPCRWRSAPEHQSRLRRKTVFDGARRGLAVGLVNKFPVRLQRPAVVLRTFRLAGH